MEKKVVIITGASRGIGRATAIQFAKEGAYLALCCKNQSSKEELEKILLEFSEDFFIRNFDISSDSDVEKFVDEIVSLKGKVDVLINNAGVVHTGKVEDTSCEVWDELIGVNLKGTFLMTKYCLPHIPNSGQIINVGSNASKIGFPNWSAYCASKFGVLGFTRSLREELRSRGIRVSSVLPGPTKTEVWDSLDGNWDRKKMMSPETTAQVIVSIVKQPDGANIDEVEIVPSGGKL